jgi:AhpD family alkylhydroperoxidase
MIKEHMKNSRIDLGRAAPELHQAVGKLDSMAASFATSAGIDEGFSHLLRLRASQVNRCAFCVRLHARDALASGESMDRINVLAAWRESQYFTEEERAALALVEAITLVSDGQVPDSVYSESRSALSDEKIAAVEWIGVAINAWNRIAIASRYVVMP